MMNVHGQDPDFLNEAMLSGVATGDSPTLSHPRIHGKRFTLGRTDQK